jgi:lysophospholipase L1-like esterase
MTVRSALKAVPGHFRDLWLAFGVALLAFLLLEGAYVAQRAIRMSMSGSDEERRAERPGHPYKGQAWFRQLVRERDGQKKQFDAWRTYWGSPVVGTYVNVDSAGRRRTVAPSAVAAPRFRVYMLGGSAMWGYTHRDSLTLPSLVAQALHAQGLTDVDVVNLAQSGYTIGQELATLQLELTKGNVPSLAVFFDGINDIRSALLFTEPGHVFFEGRLKRMYEVETNQGVLGTMVTAGTRSALIQRILLAAGVSREWEEPPSPPSLCGDVAGYYRRTAELAVAAGTQGGFDVLFLQQPIHSTSRKPPTEFERSIIGNPERNETIRSCAMSIDSAMAPERGRTYDTMSGVFDAHKETVFLDGYGHITEEANRVLAARIAPDIAARLRARGAENR